jgi:hypothetical protein
LKQKRFRHESQGISKKTVRALQSGAPPRRHPRDLLEQTAQTAARLMKFFRAILIAAALIVSTSSHAGSVTNQFVRSLGNFQLENSGDRLEISKTNSQIVFKVTLKSDGGESSISDSNGLKDGWFIFPEISRIWIFDGKHLRVVLKTEKSLAISDSQEKFKNCPKQVQDALPSKVREKYFRN